MTTGTELSAGLAGAGSTELAKRGVKDVLAVCCDGLTGFPKTGSQAAVQTLRAGQTALPGDPQCRGQARRGAGQGPPRPSSPTCKHCCKQDKTRIGQQAYPEKVTRCAHFWPTFRRSWALCRQPC